MDKTDNVCFVLVGMFNNAEFDNQNTNIDRNILTIKPKLLLTVVDALAFLAATRKEAAFWKTDGRRN